MLLKVVVAVSQNNKRPLIPEYCDTTLKQLIMVIICSRILIFKIILSGVIFSNAGTNFLTNDQTPKKCYLHYIAPLDPSIELQNLRAYYDAWPSNFIS